MSDTQDSLNFDVIIVGAGPAGLATAIRLAQLGKEQNTTIKVCVLEKGAAVGSHIIAGAVLETKALDELLPNWQQLNAPLNTKAQYDQFKFLTKNHSLSLITPPQMRNEGNYIISLSQLCRWLAQQAEALGVNIFPGFAAVSTLYNEQNHVIGVSTGDMGLNKNGEKTDNYQAGIKIYAKYTILAEGSRGSLSKQIIRHYSLDRNCDPQTYALGIKELWEIPADQHQSGLAIHTIGWPLNSTTYGGGFIYHLDPNLLAIGLVVGLDYTNTYIDPYAEMQRFKQHPTIRPLLENAHCIEYGARVINEGGIQSIPKLDFPGGVLVGCAAGFVNVPKIKGIHTAMKSGMLAAEAIFQHKPEEYQSNIEKSWIWSELYQARNIRPAFQKGLWFGLAYAAFDTYILHGKAPWTWHNHADYKQLQPAIKSRPINYPHYDGKISFDKMSSLARTDLKQNHNQPVHLLLKDPQKAISVNLQIYKSPEQRYCPAGVYEILFRENKHYLQINAQNCIHCKACDIKDPSQNITWVPPEGGGGPNYFKM